MQMMRQKPACPAHVGFKYTTFTVVLKLVTSWVFFAVRYLYFYLNMVFRYSLHLWWLFIWYHWLIHNMQERNQMKL